MHPCFVHLKELPTNGIFFQHAMTELLHAAELSVNIDYHGEKQQSFKSFLELHLTVVYSPASSDKEYFSDMEDALPTLSDLNEASV